MLELMSGLALVGVSMLIVIPKIGDTVDRAEVKSARTAAFNRLAFARFSAQQAGRVVVFKVSGSLIWAEAWPRMVPSAGSTRDTLGSVMDLATRYRVTVSSAVDSIVFDPKGFGSGRGTVLLTRGHATDSVAVNGWGNVAR
jgi:Tfp pilus assembly protein FimT